ncbi:hypothetical protein [Nitrosomonas supralitoralis]|uniref:Transmembrane protein n=1 Tax=Nitrosomonas supralitoralis TaxID=2116706 RepID=A0A2P7NWK2_9PROT|nr:hypothetical protein [Nitrosomonas supralitoralis]PSJ17846.1 hypothetical protein C7H79_06225 [Nitrosomonas supralitoralis]
MPLLRWQLGRLGNLGKVGIGLMIATGIYYLLVVIPQEAELQKLKDRAVTLQAQAASKNSSGEGGDLEASKKMSGDQALQVFYEFFPRVDSSPFWIRELVRVAKKQGVELTSSEYRLINEKDARLARYEMVLPVKGKYSQIRAFIADALEAVPAMAISAIAMKRENTVSDKLEVRLEINLYMNK